MLLCGQQPSLTALELNPLFDGFILLLGEFAIFFGFFGRVVFETSYRDQKF